MNLVIPVMLLATSRVCHRSAANLKLRHSPNICEPSCLTNKLQAGVSGAVESRDSVQHFVLTFFGDQLLEAVHDFVASRHHGFYFIFG